jgi:lipopolysaccharide/colanic/teichoic acid biosynthesis glycosyltransferase
MGLIWGTVLFVLGVAGAILIPVTARVVGDDVKEWLPWITQRLVERAVSQLPDEERARFEEEWWAHINELPGNLAKVYAAWGCLSASKAINHIALSGDTSRIEEVTLRATDVTISVIALLAVLPLMLAISICIKLDSRGPVLFKQKRLGANNIPFYRLRFRSMYVEGPGRQLAQGGYPRLTRVGRVMRMTSLDELPQLFNVLRGEMSLVGPLPLPPPSAADSSAKSETLILRRLRRLKSGITGWAQINRWKGEAKILADLYYLRNRSLIFNLLIIARTVFAVLSGHSVAPAPAPKDLWRPRTSLGFFLYIFCAWLIGLVLAITCLIVLVLGVSYPLSDSGVIHFLGCL